MKTLLSCIAVLTFVSGAFADDKPAKAESSVSAPKKFQNIDAETFDKMRRADKNAVVLDVRTEKENKAGRIPGSVLIDFNSPDFDKKVADLDKNKTYLVHCAAGVRSARACKKMETLGFKKLYNLEGGMGAWEKAGKPVEK